MTLTELEQVTFSQDFRMLLLLTDVNPAANRLAFSARLFNGGQCTLDEKVVTRYGTADTSPFDRLQPLIAGVSAAPHVLVGAGRGWQDLLTAFLPQARLEELRILDLRASLAAFAPDVKASTFPDGFATHFGVSWRSDEAPFPVDLVEDLLWHLVHLAGSIGLTWPELLHYAHTSRHAAPFDRFGFDADALATLPQVPGVYLMYDRAGDVIYVGKAQNLQQRVSGYFTSQKSVPEKLQSLWDQLDALEVRPVGSGLEALLLEHSLIQSYTPRVNVQRQIAEGRSRYGAPTGTMVLLCPSVKRGHLELFWIGLAGSTYQIRIKANRPPMRQLRSLQKAALSNRPPARASVGLTNWGPAGNEIASRYFGRFRHQLTWLESGALGETDFALRILPLIQNAASEHSDPAEIRMQNWLE